MCLVVFHKIEQNETFFIVLAIGIEIGGHAIKASSPTRPQHLIKTGVIRRPPPNLRSEHFGTLAAIECIQVKHSSDYSGGKK